MGDSAEALTSAGLLAQRLRNLRLSGFPEVRLTQKQLASALSQDEPVADSTLSSWENVQSPAPPPHSRLSAYAQFFATERSVDGEPHLVPVGELTADEEERRAGLESELFRLRDSEPETASAGQINPRFWRFDDGASITIICSDLRKSDELVLGPLSQEDNPNYAELYSYGDLDALFELYGYLNQTNPKATVQWGRRTTPDVVNHLVVLGGIAWNDVTNRLNEMLELPVQQVPDPESPSGEIFVTKGDAHHSPRPYFSRWVKNNPGTSEDPGVLQEDVGMLARLPNPYNELRTLTYCNGIHSRGVLGAVRCLTNPAVREDNEDYIRSTFPDPENFVILMKVQVLGDQTFSPSLKSPGTVLFQWPPKGIEN